MVPLYERKEPQRLKVLRFSGGSSNLLGDRVAAWLLTAPWSQFLAIVAGAYLMACTFVAEGLLLADGRKGESATFADAFLMSLQALTVFGCGRLAPLTSLAKGLALGAVFVGWLALLLVLALMMVRFILLRPQSGPRNTIPVEDMSDKEAPPSRHQTPN